MHPAETSARLRWLATRNPQTTVCEGRPFLSHVHMTYPMNHFRVHFQDLTWRTVRSTWQPRLLGLSKMRRRFKSLNNWLQRSKISCKRTQDLTQTQLQRVHRYTTRYVACLSAWCTLFSEYIELIDMQSDLEPPRHSQTAASTPTPVSWWRLSPVAARSTGRGWTCCWELKSVLGDISPETLCETTSLATYIRSYSALDPSSNARNASATALHVIDMDDLVCSNSYEHHRWLRRYTPFEPNARGWFTLVIVAYCWYHSKRGRFHRNQYTQKIGIHDPYPSTTNCSAVQRFVARLTKLADTAGLVGICSHPHP